MKVVRLHVLATCVALIAGAASAAPPPPPPSFVAEAARVLTADTTPESFSAYAAVFADDLDVFLNGHEIAHGKAAWLAHEQARIGKVERLITGHSEGYDSVFIVDQYDDDTGVPTGPGAVFDARFVTRAERYQFGPDHLIHELRIIQGGGMPWFRGG